MDTLYFWWHTSNLTGRRAHTRYRLSEADAVRTLIDPVRIDTGALTVEPLIAGQSMPSGLLRREDGAMVPPP